MTSKSRIWTLAGVERRYAAISAMSCGRSMRDICDCFGGVVLWDQMVVATGPGLMEEMRIPVPRYSSISVSVMALAAALDAE